MVRYRHREADAITQPYRRVAVKVAYRGEGFHGSQRQPGRRTVEGDVLKALDIIADREGVDHGLKASSRTDAGVSALGNVLAFNTGISDDASLLRALNAVCENVHFLSVAEIDTERNIRHAENRHYRYILPERDYDLERMHEVAALFQGVHDFRRFCRDEGRGTVIDVKSVDIGVGDVITLDFRARRFLWNMIRRMVAAISAVGTGKASVEDVSRALSGEDIQFGLAEPENLILMDVRYKDLDFKRFHDPVLKRKVEGEVHRARVDLFLHDSMLSS